MSVLVEKYRVKRREMYVAFMNLEKAYEKVCRKELWTLLHECGVDMYFIRSMSGLYDGNKTYLSFGSRVRDHYDVRKGLR